MKIEDCPLCPKHQTPLKHERLEQHTVVWCADCREEEGGRGGEVWMGHIANEVTHEEKTIVSRRDR
jgi:hypothetical protein